MDEEYRHDEARRASRRDRDEKSSHSHRRRSRSPDHKRRRRRSPSSDKRSENRRERDKEKSSRSERHRQDKRQSAPAELPFSARQLGKRDLTAFEPLFAHYLDLQKQIDFAELDDREVKGRWKSFIGKWNRGELAEGWYDPEMFQRIEAEAAEAGFRPRRATTAQEEFDDAKSAEDSESDDEYGPSMLPPTGGSGRHAGPGIPSIQELVERDQLSREEATEAREASIAALRSARKADRTLQKERLDEMAPRADAGTHERKMEKRQLINDKMREFKDKEGGDEAVDDKQLMGGGDELEEYKRAKERERRRKTEREIRKEEIERAKQEEMEKRKRAYREREEGTMGMLRELARQRFG